MDRRLIIASCFLWLLCFPAMAEGPLPADSPLAFTTELSEGVREGYLTLSWNEVQDATSYTVFDANERPVYEGPQNEAFISGLSNGTYQFFVHAFDDSGKTIAISAKPATVIVEHWAMVYAIALFGVGLVVVTAVLLVIVRGARQLPNGRGTT